MAARKTVLMNLRAGQQWRRTEETVEAGVGVGERVGRMQSNMETHTPPYVEQPAGGGLLHDSGNSHWGSATASRAGTGLTPVNHQRSSSPKGCCRS